MNDPTNDPTDVPIPAVLDDDETTVNDTLNETQHVGEDQRIDPDTSLQGYQEDVNTGGENDIIENEQGTDPLELSPMPRQQLKDELDNLAIDEQPANPDESQQEETREHVEDMDEDDKRNA